MFDENISNQLLPSQIWELGEQEGPETSQYKHLGKTIERGMTLNTVTKEASTDVTLSLLGLSSIEVEMDYRKMVFWDSYAAYLAIAL